MTIAPAVADALDAPLLNIGFDHVLVPLDGTKLALSALPTARALADLFGSELHAISVAKSGKAFRSHHMVGRVGVGAGPDDDRIVVLHGVDPAEAIVRRATELGSCLVVMSTNGRGRLGGALRGSVTRSVLTEVGPIIALGPVADRPIWIPPPVQWKPPLATQRLVACVDGSVGSEAVLPVAAAWARALEMSLSILMFVDDAPAPLRRANDENQYGFTDDPLEYVQQLAARWQPVVPAVDALVLPEPIGPGTGIRLHLAARPAGLVAVSTKARSGLQRLVRGATADTIIRSSLAPCLVVHQ